MNRRPHGKLWRETLLTVMERAGGLCEDCHEMPKPVVWYAKGSKGKQIQRGHRGYEFDHKIPISQGGDPYDPANVVLLCWKCHKEKTRREQHEWNPGVKRPVERPRIDYSTTRNAAGKPTLR